MQQLNSRSSKSRTLRDSMDLSCCCILGKPGTGIKSDDVCFGINTLQQEAKGSKATGC